jgi:RNA polymerase sigma-70 factor (ECF subfamily)
MFRQPPPDLTPRPGHLSCAPDADLVRAFAENAHEPAFTELVRRHGPMVLRICRRTLENRDDAQDAFQLTFLVLAKKAPRLRQPELVGNWLYGVALNVSRRARLATRRRRAAEFHMLQSSAANKNTKQPPPTSHLEEFIDQEIQRLPAKYRAAVVACYVQGQTNRDAARALGWPLGTLVTRLNRAKSALRTRVSARLSRENDTALTRALRRRAAPAAVPLALLSSTLKAARKLATPGIPHPLAAPHPLTAAPNATSTRFSLGKIQLGGKLQVVGVSAFGLAISAVLMAIAFGARHSSATPPPHPIDPPHAGVTPVHAPPPEAHPATAREVTNASAEARSLAAAVTQINRNALAPQPNRGSANTPPKPTTH